MSNAGKCVDGHGNLRRLLLGYLKFLKILTTTCEFSVLLITAIQKIKNQRQREIR